MGPRVRAPRARSGSARAPHTARRTPARARCSAHSAWQPHSLSVWHPARVLLRHPAHPLHQEPLSRGTRRHQKSPLSYNTVYTFPTALCPTFKSVQFTIRHRNIFTDPFEVVTHRTDYWPLDLACMTSNGLAINTDQRLALSYIIITTFGWTFGLTSETYVNSTTCVIPNTFQPVR